MLKANVPSVTALVHKHRRLAQVLIGFGVFIFLAGCLLTWQIKHSCKLRLEQGCVSLEYATTSEERSTGLSGHDSLPDNHGMLFVMKNTKSSCFWMKDMKLSLDIIWMDANKKITKIEPNLSPDSYPQTYCSVEPAAYVLEMNAGTVSKNRLQVNQTLNF